MNKKLDFIKYIDLEDHTKNLIGMKGVFYRNNIDIELVCKMMRKYLSSKKGLIPTEEEFLGKNYRGFLLNSIFNYLRVKKMRPLTSEEIDEFIDSQKDNLKRMFEFLEIIK